jgi:hypothetical protein
MSANFLSQEEKDFFKQNLIKEKMELVYKLSVSLGLDPDTVTSSNISIPAESSNQVTRSYQSLLRNLQILENLMEN